MGAVGRVLDGVEVRIGENNEIQLRGGTITKGYYKKEAITQQAFTEDGWFRTGDAGYMKDGFLYLTDRIKDLFKTSNGKYIAPQAIETKLVVDRYIDQVTIIADTLLLEAERSYWRILRLLSCSVFELIRFNRSLRIMNRLSALLFFRSRSVWNVAS